MTNYIPERQDIIWLDFDPSAGNEIRRRRPALVISNFGYSNLTGLTMVCPITHATKNNLQHTGLLIPLNDIPDVDGFINPLQLYTQDFAARNARKIDELDDETFYEVIMIINDLIS